ncbi:hypothetical protein PMKS-002012 [Pichia membranifaciens]|uniref:Bromo domain-containing protein n=1 Tax=Pichia membranifaciens TaxID=4926 RepID=A0A1Q2YGD3_9ASCO|nr:hypothetical protein PMKS-002012 [Pichia membranifaciens]
MARTRRLDDSEDDDDFNIDQSKSDDLEDDEPSEEFEEDVRDAEVKAREESKRVSNGNGHGNGTSDDAAHGNSDEDEDAALRSHRTRSRKQINYNEELYLDELEEDDETARGDDIDGPSGKHKNSDDEDPDFQTSNKRRRTRRRHAHGDADDDDDFNIEDAAPGNNDDDFIASDEEDDEDEHLSRRRKRQPNFIVKDDEYDVYADEDDEYDISKGRSSRSRPSRVSNRRNRWKQLLDKPANGDVTLKDNPKDPVTLEDELKDLQNDSPLNSPKRNLRHRKDVNYTLPSPYLTEAQLEELENATQNEPSNYSPRKSRGIGRYGGATTSVSTVRRLHPTVGPFGGSEVHSLFRNNAIPSNLAALANAESSDSDDENDLIKPTDPNDTSNNIIATLNNPASLTPAKKKNTLADTDPLGIDTNIDFSVVGGLNNYINQLKEMITLPLLYPEVYSKFHITPPRGVLFHGPPGTGKTLMARALAASCSSQNKKITFFMRKGADCLSKWVGEAERHLRLLFEEAKQHQPSIIFFDEIDGLAPVRSSKQEQIHASIVSTLLALMDGMDNRGQVIIIGATNRPDSIDPALRRPGRFDREFYFPLPDLKAREEILKIHMRKWDHQLDDRFVKELAVLTKGYGGADLRALCTESALNSIQRSYPEIYKVNDKLNIDISRIETNASDFTRALKKVIPNSSRSTSSVSEPLPDFIEPLLSEQFDFIMQQLNKLLPMEKEISLLEEAEYESLNNDFKVQQLVKTFDSMRTFRPRLGISGLKSQGLRYLSNAVLNKLEGFTIQILDLSKLYSDSSISVENLCIQLFSELKRHKPSILFIPDTIGLLHAMSETLRSTIKYLARGINNNDKILFLCEIEGNLSSEVMDDIEDLFDICEDEVIHIRDPKETEKSVFFQSFWRSIEITPNEYNDISIRPKKKEKHLEIIAPPNFNDTNKSDEKILAKLKKEQAKTDMRLKNSLKVKLAGLLDIFKARYKRFKKPVIDDAHLTHLFDDEPDPTSNYQLKNDMILEIATGKLYNNIDLEVIEERLWNGYYSEPRQFLHDLELILKDANATGDRDRMLKANEMYAHAVVGVEEIEVQFPQLVIQWKEVSRREKQRNLEYLKIQREREQELTKEPNKQNLIEPFLNENNGERKTPEAKTILAAETVAAINTSQSIDMNADSLKIYDGVPNSLTVTRSLEEVAQEEENEVLKDAEDTRPEEIRAEDSVTAVDDGSAPKQTSKDDAETQTQVQAQLQPDQVLNKGGDVADNLEMEVEPVKLTENTEKLTIENETKELIENGNTDSPLKEDVFVPEKQTVIFDPKELERLQGLLLVKTSNFKLTRLEKVNSKLCDIVWKYRLVLDKTELLDELDSFVSNLQ